MDPGKRDKRITLQLIGAPVNNECEENKPNYVDWKLLWAAVIPLKGREYLQSEKKEGEKQYRIEIDYIPVLDSTVDITKKIRVKYCNKILDIETIINVDQENDEMHLMCVEREHYA